MTNTNTDIEELEELLTELEGQEARLVTPYSEEDDAVTTLMEAPLNDQEWMVQVTALDRRMMGSEQVVAEWRAGKISGKTLVWRTGMNDWTPIGSVTELRSARDIAAGPPLSSVPAAPASLPAPPPPVARPAPLASAPMAAAPAWSSAAPSVPPPPAPQARLAPPPPQVGRAANITVPLNTAVNPGAANGKPLLPPPAAQSGFTPTQTNSTRPVAMDFPQESSVKGYGKKVYIGLGAVAVAAVVVTSLAWMGGDDKKASATAEPMKAAPQAVMGLNPPPAAEKVERAEKKPAEASPVAKNEAVKPASEEAAAPPESASASMIGGRTARASTRYVSRDYSSASARRKEEAQSEREVPKAPAEATQSEPPVAESEPAAADVEDGVVQEEQPEEGSKVASTGGKRFDKESAATVLNDAADKAKNCRPKGGPTGKGRVRIRYEPTGKVSSVSLLTSKFDNTVAGSCVTMLFRRAQVPAFNGGAVVVNKSFDIP